MIDMIDINRHDRHDRHDRYNSHTNYHTRDYDSVAPIHVNTQNTIQTTVNTQAPAIIQQETIQQETIQQDIIQQETIQEPTILQQENSEESTLIQPMITMSLELATPENISPLPTLASSTIVMPEDIDLATV